MTPTTTPARSVATLALVALLAACGGGGGSSGPTAPALSVSGSMSKSSYAYNEAPSLAWSSDGASQVDLVGCSTPSLNATNIGTAGTKQLPASAAPGTYTCGLRALTLAGATSTAVVTWAVTVQPPPATDGLVTAIPTLTVADCARLVSSDTPTPSVTPGTMEFVGRVLQSVDPTSGYNLFARLPVNVAYWVDTFQTVTSDSIGASVHETTHQFDAALNGLCNTDARRHYYLTGSVQLADRALGTKTANYSIVDEALPTILKDGTSGSRYNVYILGAGTSGTFAVLLDELTAYTNGSHVELLVASDVVYKYLAPISRDAFSGWNPAGMVDFMSYFVAYLHAARLNHPETYTTIQSLPLSRAYMQTLWTAAEQTLASVYPYSTFANNGIGFYISKDALAWVYSPDQLAELDLLGITHASSTAWNATYLKP